MADKEQVAALQALLTERGPENNGEGVEGAQYGVDAMEKAPEAGNNIAMALGQADITVPVTQEDADREASAARIKATHLQNQVQQASKPETKESLALLLKDAKARADKAEEIAKNFFLEQPLMEKLKSPMAWMKKKADQQWDSMEKKFGYKGAMALWAAGQTITWGATAGLLANELPPVPPMGGLLTTGLLAVMVDKYKQMSGKKADEGKGEFGRDLTPEEFQQETSSNVAHLSEGTPKVEDDPMQVAAPGERDKIPAELEPGEMVVPKAEMERGPEAGGVIASALASDQPQAVASHETETAKDTHADASMMPAASDEGLAILKGLMRKTPWGDEVEDPIAQDVLKHPDINKIAAEIPSGSKKIGAGVSAIALLAPNGNVIRIGPESKRPNIKEVLQPISKKVFGSTDHDRMMVETLPLVDTKGITENDVAKMSKQLAEKGYDFHDAGTDNLGKTASGELVVTDPGSIREAKDQSDKITEAPTTTALPESLSTADYSKPNPHMTEEGRITDSAAFSAWNKAKLVDTERQAEAAKEKRRFDAAKKQADAFAMDFAAGVGATKEAYDPREQKQHTIVKPDAIESAPTTPLASMMHKPVTFSEEPESETPHVTWSESGEAEPPQAETSEAAEANIETAPASESMPADTLVPPASEVSSAQTSPTINATVAHTEIDIPPPSEQRANEIGFTPGSNATSATMLTTAPQTSDSLSSAIVPPPASDNKTEIGHEPLAHPEHRPISNKPSLSVRPEFADIAAKESTEKTAIHDAGAQKYKVAKRRHAKIDADKQESPIEPMPDVEQSWNGDDQDWSVEPLASSPSSGGVPMMITADMRSQLKDLGYDDSEVNKMKPEEAWRVIEGGGVSHALPAMESSPDASTATADAIGTPAASAAAQGTDAGGVASVPTASVAPHIPRAPFAPKKNGIEKAPEGSQGSGMGFMDMIGVGSMMYLQGMGYEGRNSKLFSGGGKGDSEPSMSEAMLDMLNGSAAESSGAEQGQLLEAIKDLTEAVKKLTEKMDGGSDETPNAIGPEAYLAAHSAKTVMGNSVNQSSRSASPDNSPLQHMVNMVVARHAGR